MSGIRKDFRKVLKAILEVLPSPPVVQNAVMDFELSLWEAFPKVYTGVEILGCSFYGHRQCGELFNSWGYSNKLFWDVQIQLLFSENALRPMLRGI